MENTETTKKSLILSKALVNFSGKSVQSKVYLAMYNLASIIFKSSLLFAAEWQVKK